MADTRVGVNDAKANKLYSKILMKESMKKSYFFSRDFVGEGKILSFKEELAKNAGDRVTYQIAMTPTGHGRKSGETLEGNEEGRTMYTDTLQIDSLRHAERIPNALSIDQKRVGFDLREDAMALLSDWGAITIDAWVMNQLGGNNATSISFDGRDPYTGGDLVKATGMNTATAPSSNRQKIAGGQANDQSLTSSDTMTLNLVDACLEEAELATDGAGRIRPVMINGEEYYVMFISHEQAVDLKRDNSSEIQWLRDLQRPLVENGGKSADIFSNALGTYDKVIFHKSSRLPAGVNSSTQATVANTKRAIFCGQNAGCIAFGNGGMGEAAFSWAEKAIDYDEDIGVAVRIVGGASKTVFNGQDAGVVVASTYAARHNS